MGHLSKTFYKPDPSTQAVHPSLEELEDALQLAKLLETDDETARRVLRLVEGLEEFGAPRCPPSEMELLLPMLGTEGFYEALGSLWARVRDWVKAVIRWLTDDDRFTHQTASAVRVMLEAARLKGKANLPTVSPSGKFTIRRHIPYLTQHYRPITDVGALTSNLRVMRTLIQTYGVYITERLIPGIDRTTLLIKRLRPLDSEHAQFDSVTALVAQFQPASFAERMHLKNPVGLHLGGTHLMGNQRLMLMNPPEQSAGLLELNRSRLRLQHSEPNPRPLPPEFDFQRFQVLSMERCIDEAIELCRQIEKLTAAEVRKKRADSLDALVRAVDQFETQAKTIPDGQPARKEMATQIVRLVETLTDWGNNPYRGITALGTRAASAALYVCRTNSGI